MCAFVIRRGQIISPFGSGAIIEQKSQSFVITTCDVWNRRNGIIITEPRLGKKLNKDRFLTPPPYNKDSGSHPFIRITRFPKWHFCSVCRKMIKIKGQVADPPKHTGCNGLLVPMRFVMICKNGHMHDVPWHLWAHSSPQPGQNPCGKEDNLFFLTSKTSGGLESLSIVCKNCKCSRNLQSLMSPNIIRTAHAKCPGGQPWDNHFKFNCDADVYVVQKGASNICFPVVMSALDIPPYSDYSFRNNADVQIRNHPKYFILKSMVEDFGGNVDFVVDNPMCKSSVQQILNDFKDVDLNVDKLKYLLQNDNDGSQNQAFIQEVESRDSLKEDEYRTFLLRDHPRDSRNNLIIRNMNKLANEYGQAADSGLISSIIPIISDKIENIVMIDKLRVVSVFLGFYRAGLPKLDIFEDDRLDTTDRTEAKMVKADMTENQDWLPAIENFGEGIFINFKEDKILNWIYNNPRAEYYADKIKTTPRFLLLHTISHILIRQFAFECGYPAAAISERIYCSREESPFKMAGILLYTYGDSQGSLGGLARQGRPDRFFSVFYNAMKTVFWCSNDPLCMESEGQGLENSNLAACHSCVLLPETSCEIFNRFLDRGVVIGCEQKNIKGFFEELINL